MICKRKEHEIILLNLICIYKTKIHPNIYRYISTYILSCTESKKKKEENDISTMKTEMNEACIWQYIFLGELGGVNDVDIILGGVVT